MKSGRQDLGNGPVPKLVLGLAVPAMIAQFVNVLYSLIDRVYIGNIPGIGDLALAGVGVCGPIVTLLSSFGTLVGLGGSILMAIRMGEGDSGAARKVLGNCFLFLVGLSAVLTAGFLICREPLLRCFGASESTFVYADTYMTIYTAGTFFALMAVGLNYFITCQGYSTVGMAAGSFRRSFPFSPPETPLPGLCRRALDNFAAVSQDFSQFLSLRIRHIVI